MKNIKSSVNKGKFLIFLSFFSLFVFCAQSVSAQKQIRQETLNTNNAAESERAVEKESFLENSRAIEDSAAEKSGFASTRFNNANHGIIDVSLTKTENFTAEIESEIFRLPKNEVSREKYFSPPDAHRASVGETVIITGSKNLDFRETSTFPHTSASANPFAENDDFSVRAKKSKRLQNPDSEGFRWRPAIQQALLFLAVQHGYAMTQPKTREALKGKFFQDYFKSVKSLHGWDDGGRFFTNYIAHPMQGSFVGFIQIQNDPKGIKQRFGSSGDYWRSRMKAMAWSAAWSTQFEIGPISQASIGNVGLKGKQTWEDIIITPTVGTAMLISEDAIDRFVIERIERGTNNFYVTIFSRMLLNPTRTVANLIRFKHPWYRDRARAR